MKMWKKAFARMLAALLFLGALGAVPACADKGGGEPGAWEPEPEVTEFTPRRLENESAYDAVFYVSAVGGKDTADGSYQTPFRTLERAREAVAEVNGDMSADIAVVLREGTFYQKETLELGPADGGTNGFDVVYMAYPGELVKVNGGVEITDWRRNEEGLYYARVSADAIRNLYVDGVRATLAREPNGNSYHQISEWDAVNEKITVRTEDLKGASGGFETCLYMEWAEPVLKTESVSRFTSKSVLNFADWEGWFLFNRGYHEYQIGNSLKCWFQNAKEFLDAPGEFWFDRENSVLYYYPRENEDMSSVRVTVPNIESVFAVKGESRNERAGHVVIDGLVLENTGWYGILRYGYMEDQANHFGVSQLSAEYMAYDVLPGTVHVQNADGVSVRNCRFRNIGNIGVNFYSGVADAEVTGCRFTDVSATAVMVGPHITGVITDQNLYLPTDENVTVHDVEISDNYVAWAGAEFRRSPGITNVLGYNVTIADNEVAYCNNTGISNGWGWSLEEYVVKNNSVLRNDVHHVGMNGSDLGGIYTLSYQPGSVIAENYVHEINRDNMGHSQNSPAFGLYIDEGSNRLKILDNQLAYVQENVQFIYYHTLGTEFEAKGNKGLLAGDELDAAIVAKAGVKAASVTPYQRFGDYQSAVGYLQAGLWTNENETGKYGYKLEADEDVTIYGLGRFYLNGNTGTHELAVYDENHKKVASCKVNMKGGRTDAQGFVNAAFSSPVTLRAGKSYFVVSEETQYGDLYCGGLTNVYMNAPLRVVGVSKGNEFATVRNLNSAFVGINILLKGTKE